MNPIVLDSTIENNNSSNHDNNGSSDIIITEPSPQPCYCSSEGAFLIDNVTNSIMSVNKWIAQELYRLSHNYLPRNCLNYEALLTVVEGCYQTEPYGYIAARKVCCSQSAVQQYNKNQLLSSQILRDQKDRQSTTTTTTTTTTISDEQLTQKNLVLAFAKIIKYCQNNTSIHQFYIEHHRKPLELLLEMEKMCQDWRRDKHISHTGANESDAIHFCNKMKNYQRSLGCILFGTNMAIAKELVGSWTIICLWDQQDTSSFSKEQKWSRFGIHSYKAAKKLRGIADT